MNSSYNNDIKELLGKHFDAPLLDGYYGGVYNSENPTCLYATTLIDLRKINYERYEYWHQNMPHSYCYVNEETSKQVSPGVYESKSLKELIAEKVFNYFSMTFYGMLWDNEWYILTDLNFYGKGADETTIKNRIECNWIAPDNFWESDVFLPYKLQMSESSQVGRNHVYEEFSEEPYLVALLKQPLKEARNKAFCAYINEEFIYPFIRKIRYRYSDNFKQVHPLRAGYTLIFPKHKKYLILAAFCRQVNDEWLLYYFFFDCILEKFYRWTYFKPRVFKSSFFYSPLIINDLRQISYWDNEQYLDSSCTLDDDDFWKKCVLSQNDGKYLYLEEYNF